MRLILERTGGRVELVRLATQRCTFFDYRTAGLSRGPQLAAPPARRLASSRL